MNGLDLLVITGLTVTIIKLMIFLARLIDIYREEHDDWIQ